MTMISDRHIATYQAGQSRLTHALNRHYQDGNILGTCACGWAVESCGTDESSRNNVLSTYVKHEETA